MNERSLEDKKKIWEEIMLKCPELSDRIIELYGDGEESVLIYILYTLNFIFGNGGEHDEIN